MDYESWQAFYESDLQAVTLLLPVPALLLAALLARGAPDGERSRVVWRYAVIFAALTILDPIATGPLSRAAGLEGWGATAVMFPFVLLGDFRVFLLVFLLAPRGGSALREAMLWTAVVPIMAGVTFGVLRLANPDVPGQVLWLVYELSFVAMALFLRERVVPEGAPDERSARTLRRATAYVAVYYALWASADVLILVPQLDAGWLLRVLPNQLYYAFWVPFVWLTWQSAGRASAASSP